MTPPISPQFESLSLRQCTGGRHERKPLANGELGLPEPGGSGSRGARLVVRCGRAPALSRSPRGAVGAAFVAP